MEMIRATALVDDRQRADELMEALSDAGYEAIEIDETSTRLSATDELTAADLQRLGVASREAAGYAAEIRNGATLIVVTCDEVRTEGLFGLMVRFGLEKTTETNDPRRVRFRRPGRKPPPFEEALEEGGIHRDHSVSDGFRRADSERMVGEHDTGDATGLSRRAYGDRSGQQSHHSTEETESSRSEGAESARAILDDVGRFETSFLHHYEQNYAHNDIPFGEYARAYHYGVVLAEHTGFEDRQWGEVESFARDGWDSQTHGAWEEFAEAVRYGWRSIRGRSASAR